MNALQVQPIETLLTLEDVAKVLNISIRQVYRLIAEGKLPVLKVGTRSPRISPSDLRHYLESCTVQYGI
jgi:excisionase family DNA binding protein